MTKTYKILFTAIAMAIAAPLSHAQTSLEAIDLEYGEYNVGFRHYTAIDSTRTYRTHNEFNNRFIYRPIPISIWYPAQAQPSNKEPLVVLDYLQVLKEEEEWENLPNEFLMDWFPYLWNTPENNAHLPEKALAFAEATPLSGQYPVIVYAPSYQASSMENFALCEYLASNGYVVISSPSRGTNTRWLEGASVKDMETQSRDFEFLLREIHQYPFINTDQIGLMGFSFGGLSNALTAMKNQPIDVVVSLDGTERYNYEVLSKSAYFDLDRFDMPYVHFAQKNIPQEVMTAENLPDRLNSEFQLFDSLDYSQVHSYKFHDLTHSYFSSFGVLFANRDKRQDKSDDLIMKSYKILCEHALQYLNAFLKKDPGSDQFISNTPDQNGFPPTLLTLKTKKAQTKAFDYQDFNDLARQQQYENLIPLYKKTLQEYPDLQLQEGMLNTLGLRLSFDPKEGQKGINVFQLAVHIYPQSANLYDSMAEAYLMQKDSKNAVKYFRKSLELNPDNQNAIVKLKQLGE